MVMLPDNFVKDFVPAGRGIRRPKIYTKLVIQGVCWHWTANTSKGADAKAHRAYWETAEYGAHYVVDDKIIIHTVPGNEVVWHAGPSTDYTAYIKNKYPAGANLRLIGVELCVNSDGDWGATYNNAVTLGAYLADYYNLNPLVSFERHYDCAKKDCPRMMTPYVVGGDEAWLKFKGDVQRRIKDMSRKPFDDIKGHWAEKPIRALLQEKIISGKEDSQFHPNETATRAEVATMIYNTLRYLGKL